MSRSTARPIRRRELSSRRTSAACSATCTRRSRTGRRCASGSGTSSTELAENPPPVDPDEVAEARDLLQWIHDDHFAFLGYREYEIVTDEDGDALRALPESGLGILRATGEAPISSQLRAAAAGGAQARAREEPAQPDEGQLARDRAPARVPRLRRREALRRGGRGRRRAALPRPLHAHRLQREPLGDPGAATQGPARRRALGAAAREPRLQGTRRDHRDVPARRALPDVRGRAVRDRARHPPSRRAAAGAAVRPAGRLRPLRLVPRLPAARALQHTNRWRINEILQEAFSGTNVDFTARVSESVLARLHYVIFTPPGSVPDVDLAEIEARLAAATRAWSDDFREALLEELGEERAGPLFQRYAEAFPSAYRDDFSARHAVARRDQDREARSGRRPQSEPVRPGRVRDRAPRVQGAPLRRAAHALRRPAAAREHGRPRHGRAAVRDPAARRRADLDLRLRPPARRGCGASRPIPCARRSRTRSRACGAARPRTTASTG